MKEKRTKKCIDCNKPITRRAIRCSFCTNKGANNPNFDNHKPKKKHTDPNCQCASCKSKRGETQFENNPMYGKHHTQETRKIISVKRRGQCIKENNPMWQGGISKLPYAFEFTEELKEQIRKRDNYTCQNCGMTEEEHLIVTGKVLTIHHIDYDKQNSKEDNLITTCDSCNTRANYNRTYWQDFYQNKLKRINKCQMN